MKDHKAWASRLREREERGEVLSLYQKQCWRRALNLPENHEIVVKEQRKNKFLDE
jgi:hypothetical protein